MKKGLMICLSLLFVFTLSCTVSPKTTTTTSATTSSSIVTSTSANATKEDLMAVAVDYQSKVTQLIEEDGSRETEVARRQVAYQGMTETFNPEWLIPRSEFEAVYAVQLDNANEVFLEDHLLFYKESLDVIVAELQNAETNEATVVIQVEWQPEVYVFATVSLTADQGVLIQLSVTIEELVTATAVKFGYDGDDFYIRMVSNYNDFEQLEYFEFLEHHAIVSLMINDEESIYQHIDQDDDTLFLFHKRGEAYFLRWYNPETMIRTSLSRGIEGDFDLIELFNEKGIVFEYMNDHASLDALIAWQLLEADGWDAAYMTEHASPFAGVYLEESQIAIPARQYNVGLNPLFANVRMDMYVPKDQLSDELLSLAPYGLEFGFPDLTVEAIRSMFDSVLIESEALHTYRGIDFTGEDVKSAFLDAVDPDLWPKA